MKIYKFDISQALFPYLLSLCKLVISIEIIIPRGESFLKQKLIITLFNLTL